MKQTKNDQLAKSIFYNYGDLCQLKELKKVFCNFVLIYYQI